MGRDRDCGRVSRDVTRWRTWQARRSRWTVALLASVAPYKTMGFAPKVPYFAPLPLRSETSAANRPSLSRPHRHRRSACVRVPAAVKLAPSLPPTALMELWGRSSITSRRLEGLVRRGLLRPLSAVQEWLLPGDEGEPVPPEGYVVSFAIFHERGFRVPAHRFLWGCWITMR